MDFLQKLTNLKKRLLLSILVVISATSYLSAQQLLECDASVPYFILDLTANPDSTYTTPEIIRDGQCCSGASNENYVSFYVTLHPDVAMVEIGIAPGYADPSGSGFYNIIPGDTTTSETCGPDIAGGTPTCLTGVGPHKITYHKPGSNKVKYYLRQIPKPIYPADDTTRVGCSLPLDIYGLDTIQINSTNSSTGQTTLGFYNNLLSCTDCATPSFSPGAATPEWIDFQICGYPQATACGVFQSCDTVRLYTMDALDISVSPNPANFCAGGDVTMIASGSGGDGNYTYNWYDSGMNLLVPGDTYTATATGSYTAEVNDGLISPTCPAEYITVPVQEAPLPTVNAGPDLTACSTSPEVFIAGSTSTNSGVWITGDGVFTPSPNDLLVTYTPTTAELSAGFVELVLEATNVGSGCTTTTDTMRIDFIDTVFAAPSYTTIVCSGDLTTLDANASGGDGGYSYEWSTGETTPSVSVSAGTYEVYVEDVNGCPAQATVTVSEPTQIVLTMSSVNTSTDIACDGEASVSIAGGVAPYTVLWGDGQMTLTVTGQCYGVSTVTVTDANGCTVNGSVVVNNPTCSAFDVNATNTNVSCYGDANATASSSVSGGVGPTYTYSWNTSPVQTTPTATGLSAGTYTLTVIDDGNGCIDQASVTVTQPTVITNTMTHIDASTIGGNDGSATANPMGGTPGYTYTWVPGLQTTQTATNLTAGTYYVTIEDNNGCTKLDSIQINQPPCNDFTVAANPTNISCNGADDGSAYIVIAKGTAPFSISWPSGETDVTSVSGLAPGNYTVTVTDASNCTTFTTFDITEPAPLSLGLVATNISCNGANDGTIDLTVSGGTFPYTFEWSVGTKVISKAEDLTNLSPGTYSVTVIDANGCETSGSIGITQPNPLDATYTYSDILCAGNGDGAINATITGGTIPYVYSWTGPGGFTSTSQDISGLDKGLYELQVTDGSGCILIDSVMQAYINEPDTVKIEEYSVECPVPGDGFAIATIDSISGGALGEYMVSFDNGGSYGAFADYSESLAIGNSYTVYAQDSNGCISPNPITIVIDPAVVITAVDFDPCVAPATTDIAITVTPSGGDGGPYEVSTNGGSTFNAPGLYTMNVSVGTTHDIVIRDSKGCESVAWTITVPSPFDASAVLTSEVSCVGASDGAIDLTVTGGTSQYTYAWTGPGSFSSSSEDISGLVAGLYDVTITDDSSCVITTSITVTTILDVTPPSITCPTSGESVLADNGSCSYLHSGTAWDANATDDCTVASVEYDLTGATIGTGLTTLDGVTFELGTTTVTWTATDGLGNTDFCSYDVLVSDDQLPTFVTCGGSGTENVVADPNVCTYTHSGNAWDAVGDDNCSVASVTYTLSGATSGSGTTLDGQLFEPGVTTVTWTVTDGSGNIETCSFDVSIADSENPAIVTCGLGSDQTVNTNSGVCTYVHPNTTWNAIATDNCAVSDVSYELTGATLGTGTSLVNVVFELGTTLVTWTATDGAGNTDVCTFNVTVVDNQNPIIITCGTGGNVSEVVDPSMCTYTHAGTAWDATATDNCSIASIAYELTGATNTTGINTLDGVVFNLGITQVTWTVTDGSGNTATCSYTVTISDDQDPSFISCGASGDQNVVADLGVCSYNHAGSAWDATADDNCTVTGVAYVLSGATTGSGTTLDNQTFNLGTTTVTWTVTDGDGNTTDCSFNVIVSDDQNPSVVTCGGTGTESVVSDPGVCSYTHSGTAWDATGDDNCSVASVTYTLTGATTGSESTTLAGQVFNLGTTTVTWTVTDGSNNPATCTFDVEVNDTQLPGISTCGPSGDQTVNANLGTCTYTYSGTGWNAQATDNCSVSTIVYTLTGATSGTGTSLNGVSFELGVTNVLWTVTDGSGNTSTCSFTVTVLDDQDPAISSCGAVGTQNVNTDNGQCTYTHAGIAWDATATDNCSISSIAYTLTGATTGSGVNSLDGVTFAQGTTTVTWTVTDGSGNTDVCSFTVVVTDNELPAIVSCPADINVNNDNGDCGVDVSWTIPSFTDNCGATMTASHNPGDNFPVGSTTVIYTVTDATGNVSVCTFDVNITDSELPQLTCQSNVEQCDSLVTFNTPNATDNCGVVSVTQTSGLPSGSFFPVGTTTVTFEALDIHGNVNTCSFDVIINPTPVLTSTSTDVSCFGFGDGSIDATATSGTVPFVYTWSNGASTEDISGLQPGIYNLTVVDSKGCSASTNDTINEPAQLSLSKEVDQISCYDAADGAIDLTITGGIQPYTFNWSNGETTEDINNLDVGTYLVLVEDANGCTITNSTPIFQPDSIEIQTDVNMATCGASNGSIITQVTGGTSPYSYLWDTGATTANLSNVPGGTYTLTVTDFNGCVAVYTDSVGSSSNLEAYVVTQDALCYGDNNGTAVVVVTSGNEPFDYSWSDGSTTSSVDHLTAGDYTVTIRDEFSCDITLSFTIGQPDSLYVDLYPGTQTNGFNVSVNGGSDGWIETTVTGGTEPYTYIWANDLNSPDLYGLEAGSYYVTVIDENGCSAFGAARLTEPKVLEMPEGVSPNSDGENDYFVVRGLEAYPNNDITIYNRWGNIVYQTTGYQNDWQGQNNKNEPLPDGTYFVVLNAGVDDSKVTLTGYIDLRRNR
jgi:gliding motility-associated-like protein